MKRSLSLTLSVLFLTTLILTACDSTSVFVPDNETWPNAIRIDNLEPTMLIEKNESYGCYHFRVYEFTNTTGEHCTFIYDAMSGGGGLSCK